jgi:sporulation protein YlmC with PRC-barrel domain
MHGKSVSSFVTEKVFPSTAFLISIISLIAGFIVWFIASKSSIFSSFKTKKKRKDRNYLSDTLGLDVFSVNGEKIGKIKEVNLEDNKIKSWLIQLNKKLLKHTRKKNILVKHKYVKSIGDVIIIQGEISNYLKD